MPQELLSLPAQEPALDADRAHRRAVRRLFGWSELTGQRLNCWAPPLLLAKAQCAAQGRLPWRVPRRVRWEPVGHGQSTQVRLGLSCSGEDTEAPLALLLSRLPKAAVPRQAVTSPGDNSGWLAGIRSTPVSPRGHKANVRAAESPRL